MYGMGLDRLLVLVSPPLKSLLKGPPPSLQGIPPIWSAGLFQKASSPTVTCVQTSSHRLERPTILQYSDFRREMLESTKEGSCSCPQKKEVAGVHRRRKLLKSTEERICSKLQKEEDAQDHRRGKLRGSILRGNCSNLQKRRHLKPTKEKAARVTWS